MAQQPLGTVRPAGGRAGSGTNAPTFSPYDSHNNPDSASSYEPEGIVYDTGEEADSVLRTKVFMFPATVRDVKIRHIAHPSLSPTGIQLHNPVRTFGDDFYLDLGALGQSQVSIYPFLATGRGLPFAYQPSPAPVYRKLLHTNRFFSAQTPYTSLSYGSSLNKDYQIGVIHTQNITPRWNVGFLYDLVSRDGMYTNSEVTNHILDVTTNYYSADARYQLQASLGYNRMRQQENGGVLNDTTCWGYSRRTGVPVNMYAAQNQWRDIEVNVHQSLNTVRQFVEVRPLVKTVFDTTYVEVDSVTKRIIEENDSIVGYDTLTPAAPHTYNTGVFALDLSFARHRRIFTDGQANAWFYSLTALDTTFCFDSTALYNVSAELYWTNDSYMSHRWKNPLVLTFGVRPEYSRLRFADSTLKVDETALASFARMTLHIGSLRINADAEEVSSRRRNGDYRVRASLNIPTGEKSSLHLSALSEAVSPDLFYYRNEGLFQWSVDDYRKVKRQQAAVDFQRALPDSLGGFLRGFHARASATLTGDNVWVDNTMRPFQSNGSAMLLQASATAHLRFGWFNMRVNEIVQHSSDDDIIRVPLLASRGSVYADVKVFKGVLHLQTGFDLRHHTRFLADGWNPIISAFYRQDDVEVGNYLVADFWINLQIKRASIYLKASHFNAPLEELMGFTPSYFSLPHYPLEDFGLYWGVTWKFFN